MKRSITFAVAATAAFALSGCGAGLYSQTAAQVATVPGINVSAPGPGGVGTVSVLNATVAYPGTAGYKSGAQAPLQLHLFNDTPSPVTVEVKSNTDGTVEMDRPLTIAPGSYATPDVKITLNKSVGNADSVQVSVEFLNVKQFDLKLPVAPPAAPAPPHEVEFEEPTGDGH